MKTESRLRPFTDYSSKQRKRVPFMRSFTVGGPSPIQEEETIRSSSHTPKRSGSKKKLRQVTFSRGDARASGSSSGGHAPKIEVTEPRGDPSVNAKNDQESYHNTPNSNQQTSLPSLHLSPKSEFEDTSLHHAASVSAVPISVPSTSAEHELPSASKLNARPSSAEYTREWVEMSAMSVPSQQSLLPSMTELHIVPPATPIITPNRVEYTTITDAIDTTSFSRQSPLGSPNSQRPTFSFDLERFTRRDTSRLTSFVDNEARRLRKAEESEHDQLETMLRRRMRQISLTEHDSFGDIATLFIHEMSGTSSSSIEDPTSYSDDGKTRDELEPNRSNVRTLTLRNCKSEPVLKLPSPPATDDTEVTPPYTSPPILNGNTGFRFKKNSMI